MGLRNTNLITNKIDNKNLCMVDLLKVVCAILVVYIHVPALVDINGHINFFIKQVLCRFAVPFFFITSGYFIGSKINDYKKVKRYLIRIVKLYLIYSVIYFPFELLTNDYRTLLHPILGYIHKALFLSSFEHLWYFNALIFAIIFLYFLIKILCVDNCYFLGAISSVLYFIGVLLFYNKDSFWIFDLYKAFFFTSRNGLFFGFPLVTLGYIIYKRDMSIRVKSKVFYIAIILLVVLSYIEVRFLESKGADNMDMTLSAPIIALLVFVLVSKRQNNWKWLNKNSGKLRAISTIIYCWHMLFRMISGKIITFLDLEIGALGRYFITLFLTIFFANTLLILETKNKSFSVFY